MTSLSSSAGSRFDSRFFTEFGINGGLVRDDLEVVKGVRVEVLLVVVDVVVVGVGVVVDDVVLVVDCVVVKVRAGGRGMLLLLITAEK